MFAEMGNNHKKKKNLKEMPNTTTRKQQMKERNTHTNICASCLVSHNEARFCDLHSVHTCHAETWLYVMFLALWFPKNEVTQAKLQ